ncbi:MAG: helix-turn-helix domain-containing protein [Geminicoccaceae bacterium]
MNRPTLRKPPTLARSVSPRAPDGRDRQVGQQIRRYRLLRRLTQARVAAQAGISHQQLHKYEDGSSRISMGRLYSLAEVLNVPVTRLLSEDDRPEHPPRPASPSPSRQEELLRHVAAMAPPFQQAVLRLAKALAAEEPAPPAGLRQSPPASMAGSTGAGAAVLQARRRP